MPVVFLSSPGCAQPEPHRTWAGGSRPGRSRQLSGAPEARSPSARSRLPGGPGRGESTPDPSSGRESPPTDRQLPILSWRSLRATSGSSQNNNPLCHCVEEPFPCHISPRALLFILQTFSCDPRPLRVKYTHTSFALTPAPRPSPPAVPLPHPWVLAGRDTAHNRRHGQGQNRGREDPEPLCSRAYDSLRHSTSLSRVPASPDAAQL